jgi:peptidylprolyl isomerase
MSQAKPGDTVRIHYTGTLADGSEFDSSAGRDPLEFAIGSGQVIPGFDSAVEGMRIGEKKTVTIAAADAYGEHNQNLVHDVPRSTLPEELNDVQVGMPLQAQGPNGEVVMMTVTAVTDEIMTVDGNHPLAGKDLTFDIELVEIVTA